jgi:thiol-disulfide isomerase/thioredoxin
MHRQNVIVLGLLVFVATAVLTVGYTTGRGPVGVISAGIARLTNHGGGRLVSSDALDPKSPTAPEFAPGQWVNSEPLTLASLRGRVVLIDFWTFGCYNCRNTLPSIKEWDARYRDRGLTIVGVHSPEFDEEKNLENLRREVSSLGIQYPVVTDNDYATWKAYDVAAWPTIVVLDKLGRVRWTHVGDPKTSGGRRQARRNKMTEPSAVAPDANAKLSTNVFLSYSALTLACIRRYRASFCTTLPHLRPCSIILDFSRQ